MKEEKHVEKSNDEKIDQDFPGFPHLPAKKEIIQPRNKKEKKDAGLHLTGSKNNPEQNTYGAKRKKKTDEITSDGSAGAFDATENIKEEDSDTIRKNK